MILGVTAAGIISISVVIGGKTFAEDIINPNPGFSEQQVVTPEKFTELENKASTIVTEYGEFKRNDAYDYSKLEDSQIAHDDSKTNVATKVIVEENGIFVKQ